MSKIADIVVIGGGIHGCSIAYHLGKKGLKNVVLLERRFIASGPTVDPLRYTQYSLLGSMGKVKRQGRNG